MLDKDYLKAIFQIIYTGHWITDQVTKELKEFDISEPQYNLLKILKGANGKPLAVQEILCGMVQKSSNITRIVDKLLLKELVKREECPTNRRKQNITITPKGEDLLKLLDQKLYNFHAPLTKNLTNKELTQLSDLIKKLKTKHND